MKISKLEYFNLFSIHFLTYYNCDALRKLAPSVQFKEREKHPWRSVIFIQASACKLTKSNIPPWVFFTFFELCKWYQIAQNITNLIPGIYLKPPVAWREEMLYCNEMRSLLGKEIATLQLITTILSFSGKDYSKKSFLMKTAGRALAFTLLLL